MKRDRVACVVSAAGLTLWAALIAAPLIFLCFAAARQPVSPAQSPAVGAGVTIRSFAIAAALAAGSVLLGYVPGRLLGTLRRGRGALFGLLLAPLLLPRCLLLYAWELVRSPTTPLGDFLSRRPALAVAAGASTSSLTLVLWTWPLAALLIGAGFRALDRDVERSAMIDASAPQRLARVTLPLLAPALLLAFGLCFVLLLSEFATHHLVGIDTLGTSLAVLYAETGSAAAVARAAWPVAVPALIVAIALWRRAADWSTRPPLAPPAAPRRLGRRWALVALLMTLTIVAPVVLLAAAVRDTRGFADFYALHREELGTSLLTAGVAAAAALLLAAGVLVAERLGRVGRAAACVVHPTILLAALLPGSLLGVSLVGIQGHLRAWTAFREGWWSVSAGLVGRFAGVVLILLRFGAEARSRHLAELAATDGASWSRSWWHVHLPALWHLPVAAFVLATMLGLLELQATTVLLPAGVPNFAQSLLNQMHYARDQQVIASCLVLVGGYAALGAGALALRAIWRVAGRTPVAGLLLACAAVALAGCGRQPAGRPEVVRHFGKTGRGPGEFLYPRAIDIAADGTLWVIDKTGRLQRFDAKGRYLGGFAMPDIERGKPTGFSVGPDGRLYVADTHYQRVMVYTPAGKLLRRFGSYGMGPGQFIYPTDVAFAPDGRLFVSEYGGNDRVSIYTRDGEFLRSFGSFGGGRGQLSRPSAVKVDPRRKCLYVADACNHRIAVYDLQGSLRRYLCSVGRGPGQLRYPYDLALRKDGRLVVCEYGNNRIQVLSPDGRSLGVYGSAGRQLGQLAAPWGVCVDGDENACVVDALNNRIQVWRLP